MPTKLTDCAVHGADSGAELFIVEGDSAALAVIALRHAVDQAVLPMQGKPLNALRAGAERVRANPWLAALRAALGVEYGDAFDVAKLRYQRIVLLQDPDADGIHCRALLLMYFFRWLPALLDSGRVVTIDVPVGEVAAVDGQPARRYAYTDAEFRTLCQDGRAADGERFAAVRYRGLAAIAPETLREHCIDRRTRKARACSVREAQMAIDVFSAGAA